MQYGKTLMAAGLLLSLTTINAEASLTSYTGAGGVGLVYSSVSNVTWTQDANLFKTLYDANNNLVSQIAGVTPSYTDPYWGVQTIDAGDFNTGNGQMTWWGAKAFVNYLNDINYGGSTQWRLPTSNAFVGYNGTAGNELGQLFYSELGGSVNSNIPNTSTFSNEQAYVYWSGTEYASDASDAWYFVTVNGIQTYNDKDFQFYAWAVSPGQVSAVPIPGAACLFGGGLMSLVAFSRRKLAS
jgi:hypothetical protein